jgi:hypothetical protein
MRPYLAHALELSAKLKDMTSRPEEAMQDRHEAAELQSPGAAPPTPEMVHTAGHA